MCKNHVYELIDTKISMENNLGQYLKKQKLILNKERNKIKKLEKNVLILQARLISNGTIKIVQNEQQFNAQDSKIIKWLQKKDDYTKAKNRLKAMKNNLKYKIINNYIPIDYKNYEKKEAVTINELRDIIILYFVYDYNVRDIASYYNKSLDYIHKKIKNL